jgi:hypothetical protein
MYYLLEEKPVRKEGTDGAMESTGNIHFPVTST